MELLLTVLLLLTIPGLVTYLVPATGEPVRNDS
jgi:hypothetical protein